MRLDWFLPALRRPRDGHSPPSILSCAWARRILPASWFSNPHTKQRGRLRRALRWLGTSWLYSPLRRLTQAACFVAFLAMFFYVCWPYSAQPASPPRQSTGWRLVMVSESGQVVLSHEDPPPWTVRPAAQTYLRETATPIGAESEPAIQLETIDTNLAPGEWAFLPADALNAEALDRMLLAEGAWTLWSQPPDAWPSHYADDLARKERVAAEFFLVIDPLVSLSTAIAARHWVWSLVCALAILAACILIPRGFCGYVCPLGTLIDLFDWAIASRVKRFRVSGSGWWVHTKYYLLLGCLLSAVFGVLVTGYVAAIPVVTRGMLLAGEPLQTGFLRGWHLVPPFQAGHFVSLALFAAVLLLGFLQPRFWCKYVCPSGAVFSLGNLLRLSQRHVESTCIHCNKCVQVCPFDAIKPDFTTRVTDCTLCQTCGGVCPTHAIKFVERGNRIELKVLNDPPTGETAFGRRGFLSAVVGTAAASGGAIVLTAATRLTARGSPDTALFPPVRPPGSVPEEQFLQLCIRCGECFKACPNNVLQPMSFRQGLAGLWTPEVVADWAGCESSCNACGQVCPTGAIRALPLETKKTVRMGLAIVDQSTCLPWANREACQLCVDECVAAGYHAIEFTRVHTLVDESGAPLPDSGYVAPVVLADRCVGCGLCQTRCYGINVQERDVLSSSAIVIRAGEGREDRLLSE